MKKLIFSFVIIMMFGCTSNSQVKPEPKYIDQGNYIVLLKDSVKALNGSVTLLNDSILKLNRRAVMTSAQFVKIYKYERLYKYYRICANKPSQWIYYKGWSIRVFTE